MLLELMQVHSNICILSATCIIIIGLVPIYMILVYACVVHIYRNIDILITNHKE